MSKFFSLKLYRQGLKKIRVPGVAVTLVVAVLSAVPAIIILLNSLTVQYYAEVYGTEERVVSVVGVNQFALPLILLLFLAPILTLNMFRFLNRRNESDFYHAIPFTRPCVFFSFTASVLTWLAIAIALPLFLVSFFHIINPYVTFAASTPFILFGVYLLATAMLTAFTVMAMTLTGTGISNLLMFMLLVSFVRIVGGLFIGCLDSTMHIWIPELTPAKFMEVTFNLPIVLLSSPFISPELAFSNPELYIYTIVVTLLVLAASCFLYTIRRSEMAGRSAPSRLLQHIYRCAITMPLVIIITSLLITSDIDLLSSSMISLIALTLLCYYLFEIITTKQLKNCISATPYLLVLLAGGMIFAGSVWATRSLALSYTPEPEQIKTIALDQSLGNPYGILTYEDLSTQSIEINDPAALELVSAKLKEAVQIIKTEGNDSYRLNSYGHEYDDYGNLVMSSKNNYLRLRIKINGRGGRVCGRYLRFTEDEYYSLVAAFQNSSEYQNAWLSLPSEKQILTISAYNSGNADKLWESFVKEYNALPIDAKVAYKQSLSKPTYDYDYETPRIVINGIEDVVSFRAEYIINPEYFPKTYELHLDYQNQLYGKDLDSIIDNLDDTASYYVIIAYNNGSEMVLKEKQLIINGFNFLEEHKTMSAQDTIQVKFLFYSDDTYTSSRTYMLTDEEITQLKQSIFES